MSQEEDRFPQELLDMSIDERLDYFYDYRVAHTHLLSAKENVLRRLRSRSFPVITVIGPAGVGKTTLGTILVREVEMSHDSMGSRGQIPAILVQAPAHSKRDFNWKDFYIKILEAANEPLMHYKYDKTEIGFANSVKEMVKHRRPYVLIIDEAQHIIKKATPAALVHQLDAWKTFVESIYPTKVVLLGTYELFNYYSVNGQIDRRGRPLHLPRYRSYVTQDSEDFQASLYALQRHMPIQFKSDLTENWNFYYERSVGCVGILKDWLYDALDVALREGKEQIDSDYIREFALSVTQCENILDEVRNHENDERLFNPATPSQVYSLMIWSSTPLPPKDDTDQKNKGAQNSRGNANPGVRKPTRDPIGPKTEPFYAGLNPSSQEEKDS